MARMLNNLGKTLAATTILVFTACAPRDHAITPHTYAPRDIDRAAKLSLPQLEEELQSSLELIRAIDPELVAEGFAKQRAEFDEGGCPSLIVHNSQDVWSGDCTTETGLEFHGNYLNLHWYEMPVADEWFRRWLWNSGQANIIAQDGTRFLAMGDAWVGDYDDADGIPTVSSFLHGDFLWESEDVAGTWLQELYYLYFDVEAKTFPDGRREVWLNGDVARLPRRIHAVTLQDVTLRRGPEACSDEPEGTLRFHDLEAHQWYLLEFDGHGERGEATERCDGCGELSTLDGEPLGTLCPDMGSWLSWERWPW